VLRRGLEALELQHMEPSAHPVLRLIGLADVEAPGHEAAGLDAAREHDRLLCDSEEASWQAPRQTPTDRP
jgi:hypothetical protein